ncbi:hypothetical protein [Streptomyces sp. NPDC056169]|uniref:hypothetical protein n=1 Tax=Streptomyces sp. NPDC056169 TaxID=3345734 RepID=UPI0035E0AB63
MTRSAQRRVVRAASASILAAGLALSAGMPAMAAPAAAPAQAQAVATAVNEPVPPPGEGEGEQPPPPAEEVPPPAEEVPPPAEEVPPPAEEVPPPAEEVPPPPAEEVPPPPPEGGEVPPVENGVPPEQTPDEIKKQVETGIANSSLSAAEKAKVQKSLDSIVTVLNDPDASKEEKESARFAAAGIKGALELSKDPKQSTEAKARFAKMAVGLSEAQQRATDPELSGNEQAAYREIITDLNSLLAGLAAKNVSDADRAFFAEFADLIVGGLLAVQQPGTAPTNPEDKKKVQENLKKNAAALKVYQNPNSSQEDKDAAKATLDEQAGATTSAKYLELVDELKRLKAPQACLDVVQNRTQQAGWPDGSLWALTDKSCVATVKAGAADTNSDWNALFSCVLTQAFSTCTARIPE